ncbi:MAG: hypothetical protein PF487_06830 [Bacteroidales bacterium]|nr:hypothetical protein [Bacteroidales bacterium]
MNIDPKLRIKLEEYGKEKNIPVYYAQMDSNNYKINIKGLGIDGIDGAKNYQDYKEKVYNYINSKKDKQ